MNCELKPSRPTIFYDGACPVCANEIAVIQAREHSLSFVNIHSSAELPLEKNALLRNLHAYLPDGSVLVGLDANLYIWRSGPWRVLSILLSLPILHGFAKFFYDLWANKRYKKLYQKGENKK